ncbi:MAG: hypothetical protein ACI8ZN_001054 [Bacteroidia bacterium]
MRARVLIILFLWQTIALAQSDQDSAYTQEEQSVEVATALQHVTPAGNSIRKDTSIGLRRKLKQRDTLAPASVTKDEAAIAVLRTRNRKWWVFSLLVFILILVGVLQNINPSRHKYALVNALFLPPADEKTERYEVVDWYQIIQMLVTSLILAAWLFLLPPFDLNLTILPGGSFFGGIMLFFILLYMFKYFIHYLVAIILQADQLAIKLVVNISNIMYFYSIVLLPFLLIGYYSPYDWSSEYVNQILLSITAIFLLIRFIRIFVLYLKGFPFSKIYIILYFCALEIVPLLFLLFVNGGISESLN